MATLYAQMNGSKDYVLRPITKVTLYLDKRCSKKEGTEFQSPSKFLDWALDNGWTMTPISVSRLELTQN